MAAYLKIIITWKFKFFHCDFKYISRSENNHADFLATCSAVDFQLRGEIPVEYIPKPSIHKPNEEVLCLDSSSSGGTPSYYFSKIECFPRTMLNSDAVTSYHQIYTF